MTKRLRAYQETFVYVSIFALLFLAPVLTSYIRSVSDSRSVFHWHEVFGVWKILAVFLVLFLIHNYLLAPLLIYRRKKVLYFAGTACLLAAFTLLACWYHPGGPHRHRPPMEMRGVMRPPHHDFQHGPVGESPQGQPHESPSRERPHGPHRPPLMFGQADLVGFIMLFFMLGMNLGVKLYFKNEHDRKGLEALEKENLAHQLEYLKYQINPHFFMNTLNNIHALVDIAPEKAKSSIVVLSKMMRYILYEGNHQMIPLQRELEFISHYIALMCMRYTDKVSIHIDMPQTITTGTVPPLLLITFVENAFKHGISYSQESFIDLSVSVGSEISFLCKNSKKSPQAPSAEEVPQTGSSSSHRNPATSRTATVGNENSEGGVGLANVRQRLDLLYNDHYHLDITDTATTYTVQLTLPLSPISPDANNL